MTPKKNLIEAAQADGSMDRLNQLLSASHILLCESNNLIEEAADIMGQHGLLLGMLKKRHNELVKASDNYFSEFGSMITTEKSKMDMFSDMDDFDNVFRKWAKISKDWKSTRDKNSIEYAEKTTESSKKETYTKGVG